MRLIIIGGPTASGKSGLAMRLAEDLHGEIISADSVQVYKGLDIGSAKPGRAEMERVKHHLIDILEPGQNMDAGLFVKRAELALGDITTRGKVPIIVGGTGLYITAFLFGLAQIPAISQELRDNLKLKLEKEGLAVLHKQLAGLDPQGAERIKDRQRILRALEVVLQTGKPLAYYQQRHDKTPRHNYLLWGMERPREELRRIIAQRAEAMWHNGLMAEVENLLSQGVDKHAPALRSLGYCQALAVINRQMDEKQALEDMIRLTRAYAKRQVTWFKKMPGIRWIVPDQYKRVLEQSRAFLRET